MWMLIILALHHWDWDNWNGPNLTQSSLNLCNAIESNKCNQEVITSLSKVNRWYYELGNIRAIEHMSTYVGGKNIVEEYVMIIHAKEEKVTDGAWSDVN